MLVALETTRGLLVYDLLCHGYHIYAINPKAVNRYKDRHVLSAAGIVKLLRLISTSDNRGRLIAATVLPILQHIAQTSENRRSFPLQLLPTGGIHLARNTLLPQLLAARA